MKQFITGAFTLMVLGSSYSAMAQEPKEELKTKKEKETQEIIIRKKGDKDIKVTVEVNGDNILINGKPLAEYKGDDVTVSKRKVHFLGNGDITMNINGKDFKDLGKRFSMNGTGGQSFMWNDDNGGKEEKYTFLGVSTEDAEDGAKVTSVSDGSGAEKAGLKEGDIITKVGDKKISNPADLSEAIRGMKPKDEAKITYKRDGKQNTVKATLSEKVEKNVRVFSMAGPDMPNWNQDFNFNFDNNTRALAIPRVQNMRGNFNLDNINVMGRSRLGLKIQDLEEGEGVKVLDLDEETAAAKAGLKKDDIITEIDGKKISNTDDAREQLKPNPEKKSYSIKAKRGGSEMSFEVKVPKKIKTASF